jgi:hypothetical protein
VRHLAALVAAVAVLVSTGVFEPSPVAAYAPPKPPPAPSPQDIQRHLQEQHRKEQEMLQQWLRQQQLWHQHMQKQAEEYRKQQQHLKGHVPPPNLPKHGAPPNPPKHGTEPKLGKHAAPPPPPKHAALPHHPKIEAKQFPLRRQASAALVQASHHIHAAAGFPAEQKALALGSIHEAILRLGEGAPAPAAPLQKGDHIRLAEGRLHSAHKDVVEARRLPHELKVPVLAEIHRALFYLTHPAMPFPTMEQARHQLVQALHQVHASGLPDRPKGEALTNIRQALLVLGEVPPAPSAPVRGDHLRLAEGHLYRAHKDVVDTRHLPPQVRGPVLAEINNALFLLKSPTAPFPNLKEARDQLVRAWHQVQAASGMGAEMKELALTSIGEAMIVLGESVPRPWPSYPGGDHLRLAEEHLQKAHADVVSKTHLPHELKAFVLEEIKRANVVLKHSANPGGRGIATK